MYLLLNMVIFHRCMLKFGGITFRFTASVDFFLNHQRKALRIEGRYPPMPPFFLPGNSRPFLRDYVTTMVFLGRKKPPRAQGLHLGQSVCPSGRVVSPGTSASGWSKAKTSRMYPSSRPWFLWFNLRIRGNVIRKRVSMRESMGTGIFTYMKGWFSW